MAPRGNFGSGWEQRSHPSMQGPPAHGGSYDYYGGQSHLSDAQPPNQHPGSVPPHGAGPTSVPSMGPPSARNSEKSNSTLGYVALYPMV
ncbi:hypothetical protein K1719_043568 [Acacia pycnantha]|nr:hypothetical protein K1719_043568 [Acacia pycnantha]